MRADGRGDAGRPSGKVDTEAQQLASAAQVRLIPMLMAFRDGVLAFSQPGALRAAELEQLIRAVRDIDMDDVGQDIAAQQTDRSA